MEIGKSPWLHFLMRYFSTVNSLTCNSLTCKLCCPSCLANVINSMTLLLEESLIIFQSQKNSQLNWRKRIITFHCPGVCKFLALSQVWIHWYFDPIHEDSSKVESCTKIRLLVFSSPSWIATAASISCNLKTEKPRLRMLCLTKSGHTGLVSWQSCPQATSVEWLVLPLCVF